MEQNLIYDLNIADLKVEYTSSIEEATRFAESEIQTLNETIESIKGLKPKCDKIDYALAVSSGALCGIIDIFLVGKPGESPLGNITDKWFENRVLSFANIVKKSKWNKKRRELEKTKKSIPKFRKCETLSSAIRYLEKIFDIPYDQRGMGDAASFIFDLNATNHHFKSLAHNPSLLGLFFSILDQFTNTSHFVSEGELISLQDADGNFELRGKSTLSKIFCGFVNWIGHLVSDMSGASSSKGRGMGIPSPLWTWTNDVIALKRHLNINVSEFDKSVNELALNLYEKGYDARFQTTQAIPVVINELLVRLIYSIRRLIRYFSDTNKENRSFKLMWKECEPFKNPTVKRMLTVAHGTFCVIDAGEATIRAFIAGGGTFNPLEFFMRLNIAGVGRFTISLYGEIKRGINIHNVEETIIFARREKIIIEDYIKGLNALAVIYDDKELVDFADDLRNGMYIKAFEKTVKLAEKRNVPEDERVNNKSEIDKYFMRGKTDE